MRPSRGCTPISAARTEASNPKGSNPFAGKDVVYVWSFGLKRISKKHHSIISINSEKNNCTQAWSRSKYVERIWFIILSPQNTINATKNDWYIRSFVLTGALATSSSVAPDRRKISSCSCNVRMVFELTYNVIDMTPQYVKA